MERNREFEEIGQWIKQIRAEEGLSQEAFGNVIGVSQNTVSQWESGQRGVDIQKLNLIAEHFGASISLNLKEKGANQMKTKKQPNLLVACIKKLKSDIESRFMLVDLDEGMCKDVTMELCHAIEERAEVIKGLDGYHTPIPYEFKSPYAVYRFGCGLTHYLEEDTLQELAEYNPMFDNVKLKALTPNDLKHILGVKNADDRDLVEALIKYYG